MEKQKNIVCGADIHKKFIMATILSRDGNNIRGRFGMTLDEILRFKEWVINNNCEAVQLNQPEYIGFQYTQFWREVLR